MTGLTYYVDALVPAWLQYDPGYRSALGDHLLDRLALNEITPAGRVHFGPAPSDIDPPVGTVLLRAMVEGRDFEIEMVDEPDDEEEEEDEDEDEDEESDIGVEYEPDDDDG
ncbi:hypothetical protein [Streptomyces sp. NPDC096153]|uniref:hypothetical protein n=1 Tax=Streptomyces sp. NPDC096153 TaxID=3155548 RepID=UPI0033186D30